MVSAHTVVLCEKHQRLRGAVDRHLDALAEPLIQVPRAAGARAGSLAAVQGAYVLDVRGEERASGVAVARDVYDAVDEIELDDNATGISECGLAASVEKEVSC
jgi:hypothetical protein